MKDFRGMKRQRSRNRKPSGNSNNPNRAYESNGPEGTKVRGNAQTIYEKYQQLARDANASGDRVLAENHLQHAEHYFRLIRQMQPQRPVSEFVQRDPFSNGFDDFDDEIELDAAPEAEIAEAAEPQGEESEPRDNRDRNRDRNHRNDRNDRYDRDRNGYDNRNNDSRGNDNRGSDREGDGNRRETRRERYERRRAQRLSEQEQNLNGEAPAAAPVTAVASTEPLAPATPRPAPAAEDTAAHLPAFLRQPALAPAAGPPLAEAEEAPKPRRGRRRKTEEVSAEDA